MSEDEFEAAVGRIERDYEERGADLTDVYLIVDWARKSRELLIGAADAFNAIAEHGLAKDTRP